MILPPISRARSPRQLGSARASRRSALATIIRRQNNEFSRQARRASMPHAAIIARRMQHDAAAGDVNAFLRAT